MARQKKTSNGYYRKTFMYDGKRYCVYGKDSDELLDKVNKKKAELQEGTSNHENPTLNSYYEYFTDIRLKEQKESTIRTQRIQFKTIAETVIKNDLRFGDMKIRIHLARRIEYQVVRLT